MKRLVLAMGMACAMLGAFGATTVYVDRSADPATADGSEAHPYVTIQKGVDEVEAGGTVRVLPGIYDEGGALGDSGCSNRVFITKSLTLQATSSCRTNTIIRGAYDMSATDGWYAGTAGMRCVEVKSGCTVFINGFTLEKGRTHRGTDGANENVGGLVYGSGTSYTFVQDCILRDGAARSGGAAQSARIIRCFVTECSTWNVGNCLRGASAYNTIFARNATNPNASRGGGVFAYASEAVNCTVVENGCGFFNANNDYAYNCAIFNNLYGVGEPTKCDHCVSDDPAITGAGADKHNLWAPYSACIYSPVQNDYRLLAGCACIGAGADGTRMGNTGATTDFFGTAIDRSHINVGAVQTTVAAIGNPVFLDGSFAGSDLAASGLDTGSVNHFGSYPKMVSAHSSLVTHFYRAVTPVYPDAVKIVLPSLPDSYGNIVVTNTEGSIVSIGWDNTAYLPVSKTGVTNFLQKAAAADRAVWVDKHSTAEGAETGTADHPFRKLQDGIDALGWYAGVVFVKPGDYDEGGRTLSAESVTTHNCRLAFWNGVRVRVVAVEGPNVTSIVGASDPDDPVDGFGPNAVRCVASYKNWNFVSGFTLKGSRVGAAQTDENADKLVRRGGAAQRMYTNNPEQDKLFLTDCVITNCTGREGSIGYGVTFVRCRITDSGRCNSTPYFTSCTVVSSTVRNCGPAADDLGTSSVLGSGSVFYNVSLGPMHVNSVVDDKTVYNSVLATGLSEDLNWNSLQGGTIKYTLYENSRQSDSSFHRGIGEKHEGLKKGKAVYRDVAHGGFELTTLSDALGLANYDMMYKGCPIGVDGVPYVGSADGRFNAGACATVTRGVSFETDWADGISPSAARGFDANGELSLTATAERPFLGFKINDETVVPADHGRTYTLKESDLPEGPVTVRALYGTQFFVSPTGSDENDGFYEDSPFLHFSTAFAKTLASDEIVALPGEYGEEQGASAHTDGAVVKSRVIVPSGRTLRSRDGAATTTILGKASDENKDGMGLGPDAVRCVYLNTNAKLYGFTLKGGRTDKDGTADTVDTRGGGVLAYNTSGVASDCVFDDCASVRGGSAHSAYILRSRFVNGKSPHYAGIFVNNCLVYRCVFGSSYSLNGGASAVYNGVMESCTVCPGCCTTGADLPAAVTMSGNSAIVVNTIVANGGTVSAVDGNVRNCAFKTGTESKVTGLSDFAPSVFGDVEVNADGVPVIGRNVGIDAANADALTATTKKDIAGCDHFWNNAWDMGAYEVDWRDHYAQAISGGKLAVDEAPATAVEQTASRQVRLTEGALEMSWRARTRGPVPMTLDCSVPGTGTLVVSKNGEVVETLTAGQSKQIVYADPIETDKLTFAYEPGANDELGALIGKFTSQVGVLLIVR